ncbi:hypothetical protein BLA29_005432 [Euroglyphus maynei]|uniref:Uncharacterized protein n=1 Tax=Euroglyphus maynei TaxID=6958 RepID=A0A1Y3BPH5_EURMA|nr:hypothetical protein BLA29_005432 [Euroglyphus maynei]
MERIHNPYLRIFVHLHGTFGIQLSSIRLNDWHSILTLVINISLNIITYWGIFIDSPASDQIWSESNSKQMYNYLRKANFYAIYPILYFGSIGSYIAYGHRIITGLDSNAFIIVSNCKRNRWKAFFIFMIGLIFWHQRFILRELRYLTKPLFLVQFRTLKLMAGMYLYHATQLTNWYLLFYYQLNTFFTLRQIVKKLWPNKSMLRTNSFSIERRLFRSIILLSEQSRRLQYYFSFIILFILIELSDSIVGNLCFLMIESFGTSIGWFSLYEQSIRWSLLFALVEINRQNLMFFNQIVQHFNRKLSTIQTSDYRIARYSKYNQLKIYQQYYPLSLFNWLNVNVSLLINIFFFSFGYVLIISQTAT